MPGQGFAALTPERRKEIAVMGGKAVPSDKRAFSNKKLAAEAGRKGGKRRAEMVKEAQS